MATRGISRASSLRALGAAEYSQSHTAILSLLCLEQLPKQGAFVRTIAFVAKRSYFLDTSTVRLAGCWSFLLARDTWRHHAILLNVLLSHFNHETNTA